MARKRPNIQNDNAPKQDKRYRKRHIVYLNDDGTVDQSSLPDDLKPNAGGSGPSSEPNAGAVPPPPPAPPIDPAMIGMFLPVLVAVEAAVVAPRMNVTVEDARRALTPAPPIADAIQQALAKVLDKYGATLGEWQAEIALLGIIAMWQVTAFAELRRMQPITIKPEPPPPSVEKNYSIQPDPEPPAPPAPAPDEYKTPYDPKPFAGIDGIDGIGEGD